MSVPRRLRLGLPKGSLQETTRKLLALAGYDVRFSDRSYYPDIDDPEIECILIRPQEMPRYIEQGVMDCGIAGHDWIVENAADVEELADLEAPWPNYGRVRWVLAVKRGSGFASAADLEVAVVEGDLLVSAGPHRRSLRMPERVAACSLASARLAEGELVVGFEGDPPRGQAGAGDGPT